MNKVYEVLGEMIVDQTVTQEISCQLSSKVITTKKKLFWNYGLYSFVGTTDLKIVHMQKNGFLVH